MPHSRLNTGLWRRVALVSVRSEAAQLSKHLCSLEDLDAQLVGFTGHEHSTLLVYSGITGNK